MPFRRLVREPLVHFLVLGVALLAVERRALPAGGREIVVDAAAVRGLAADHERRTGLPPTPAEQAALVTRWLEDEALYREALALGLDRGDVIVRRRLVQKMELLTEDLEPVPAPDDATLAAWLAAHADRYAAPLRVSLEHVFVAGAHPEAARALGARLAAGADARALGDPFLHGRTFAARTTGELARVFGDGFARAAAALPAGTWSAPIRSSYGLHLVRVTARDAGGPAALAAVRDAVARDWTAAEREQANRAARARVRARYRVTVEPDDVAPAVLAALR
jgi:peptidyl-prolyl cis-trans isomerase C